MLYGSEISNFEEYEEITLPRLRIVCPRCEGRGTHTNPNIDGNGITSEEMEEYGEDFQRDYLAGRYDVPCEECGGNNVIEVVDFDACSDELKAELTAYRDAKDSSVAAEAAERAFGC